MKFKLYPSNWDYQTWRKFLVIAGIWNFSFALPALLFPSFMVRLMYGFQTSDFYILYLNSSFFGTFLIFGIGYLLIAYDPGKNLGIVLLGIIGKTIVGIAFYYLYNMDRVTIMPVLAGTGDLIFTFYFIYYLTRGPRSEKQS